MKTTLIALIAIPLLLASCSRHSSDLPIKAPVQISHVYAIKDGGSLLIVGTDKKDREFNVRIDRSMFLSEDPKIRKQPQHITVNGTQLVYGSFEERHLAIILNDWMIHTTCTNKWTIEYVSQVIDEILRRT